MVAKIKRYQTAAKAIEATFTIVASGAFWLAFFWMTGEPEYPGATWLQITIILLHIVIGIAAIAVMLAAINLLSRVAAPLEEADYRRRASTLQKNTEEQLQLLECLISIGQASEDDKAACIAAKELELKKLSAKYRFIGGYELRFF